MREKGIIAETEKKISRCSDSHLSITYLFSSAENLNRKVWYSVVYAFYKEWPKVVRKDNRKGIRTTYLEFSCAKCTKSFLRGTRTDSGSMGVMCKHISACWDEDVWNEAKNLELNPAKEVVNKIKNLKNVKLTEIFARVPGLKETYSLAPPSREEIRWVFYLPLPPSIANRIASVTVARWVSESMRPFLIVKDRGLRWLCKTGRLNFYLPDNAMVAKDVKLLYGWSERQLAEELQVSTLFSHLQLTLMCFRRITLGSWHTN